MKKLSLVFFLILWMPITGWTQPFKIIDATSRQWVGGRKDSGKGVNYNFTVVTKVSSKKLAFKKVWLDSLCFDVDDLVNTKFEPVEKFNRKDTLIIRVSWISAGPELKNLPDCKPYPVQLKTMKNMVEYIYRKRNEYYHIRNLRALEKQYRQ